MFAATDTCYVFARVIYAYCVEKQGLPVEVSVQNHE